jgi:hypothetical protein
MELPLILYLLFLISFFLFWFPMQWQYDGKEKLYNMQEYGSKYEICSVTET